MDASVVYGSDLETANNLRSFAGGKLKIESNGLLPTSDQREGQGFVAGDHRSTENPLLSSLQTLWVREHNRICDQLSGQQPGLSDERLYQKARVKVMGLLQHITYNEFLPAVLGDDALTDYKGYDAEVNPGIFNEFAAAAYRFGHSMISDTVAQRDHDGSESASGDITLKDAFFNIQVLQQSGIDTVLRGASLQQAQEVDTQYVDGLRNFLFSAPPEGSKCPMRGVLRFTNGVFPGLDLGSRNIQRGRDHGLDSYNDIRETLGLKRLETFEEITSDQDLAQRLKELYNNDINNVDLYVAGLAEDHVEGSSLGEVFGTIIKRQFEAIRDGDRFWHENEENKLFSEAELAEIKGTKLSDVIERNTEITGLRDNVFLLNIKGTAGDDLLNGTHLADQFCASMGHDRIDGGESFDTIDYTTLEGPITLRFDGVLKGSNSLDGLGIAAMEGLQELASKGNQAATQIFSLHQRFFGQSASGFFNQSQSNLAQNRADAVAAVGSELGFDHISDIEQIQAGAGSTIDGRGAVNGVDVDLAAESFSTNLFGQTVKRIVKGFSNIIGSESNDIIQGNQDANIMMAWMEMIPSAVLMEQTQYCQVEVMTRSQPAMVMTSLKLEKVTTTLLEAVETTPLMVAVGTTLPFSAVNDRTTRSAALRAISPLKINA